ncbi:MAG: alpha-glucosidase C-terminal domain-containing protein, partial [Sphingomonadales bacterium]
VLAYVREAGDKKVLVFLNLSAKEQTISIKDKTLIGTFQNAFTGQTITVKSAHQENLSPWGYAVYVR